MLHIISEKKGWNIWYIVLSTSNIPSTIIQLFLLKLNKAFS
jgi:hypothetical protein